MKVREFLVQFRSFRDIQDFVALASKQSVRLNVGNEWFRVNASSLMGMLALSCRSPQKVTVNCSDEEFQQLMTAFDRFLVK